MSDTQTRTEPLTLAPHEAAFYLSMLLDKRAQWETDGNVPSAMMQHQIRAVSRYLYGVDGDHVANEDRHRIRWEAENRWEALGEGNPVQSTATTPIGDDDGSGMYHVLVGIADVGSHRYAVQAADSDDASAYVQLVCLPVDYPGRACEIQTVSRVR